MADKESQVRKLLEQFINECNSRSDLLDWRDFQKDQDALLDYYTKSIVNENYNIPYLPINKPS